MDGLKQLGDAYDFGELRQEFPFQSSLVSSIMGTGVDQLESEWARQVTNFCSLPRLEGESSMEEEEKTWNHEINSEIITKLARASLKSNPSSYYYSTTHGFALADGLRLAGDLIPFRAYTVAQSQIEYRAELEKRQSAMQAEIDNLRDQLNTAHEKRASSSSSGPRGSHAQRSHNRENEMPSRKDRRNGSADGDGSSSDLANRFKSAKRQFVEDEDGDISSLNGGNERGHGAKGPCGKKSKSSSNKGQEKELPPELAHLDKVLVEKIEAEIVSHGQPVSFDDIAGLTFAKSCVHELICWPMSRPDLFTGLRCLPKGVLLFGPPGTGKTLIGKAISHEAGATFFSISASSLTSKWIGEGEKLVKTLFAVAAYRQPSVVFIDEVDSLLCARSSDENEATRRLKTEFLVQLDGAATDAEARVVIVGATNRPEELDEAARRRFVKRIFVPLPDAAGREQLVRRLLTKSNANVGDGARSLVAGSGHCLTEEHMKQLVQLSRGFSGADIHTLCTEAAMWPVRELAKSLNGDLSKVTNANMPLIEMRHFEIARENVQPSVSPGDLDRYMIWNAQFGTYKNIPDKEGVAE